MIELLHLFESNGREGDWPFDFEWLPRLLRRWPRGGPRLRRHASARRGRLLLFAPRVRLPAPAEAHGCEEREEPQISTQLRLLL